jgi:NAD(P)-dependent dehydrogenase (short-subunit alcohol dehydrogenase family)
MDKGNWPEYQGARAIVTGCFSGIGHAVASRLLENGAEVHGIDWKRCDLPLESFKEVDLRDAAAIEAAVRCFDGEFVAIFNCAGIAPGGPPLDVVKVNYIGTRAFNDGLMKRMAPGGAIVNVASNGGMRWNDHLADLLDLVGIGDFDREVAWCEQHEDLIAEGYRFSKEAVIVWTLAGAAEAVRQGIRTNAVLPGAVQTPMLVEIEKSTPAEIIDQVAQPIGRRSSAYEQAEALLFLNSPRASYINGVLLPVDGGFMATMAVNRP